MLNVHDIPLNLIKIKRRAIGFWATTGGAIAFTLGLFLLEKTGVAKVVMLAGIILSIATWMSAMMSICPACKESFHEGLAPRLWPHFGCAHCDLRIK